MIAAPPTDRTALDRVVATVRTGGLDGSIRVDLPAGPGRAWTVTQNDYRWPVAFDSVAVDAAGTAVVDRVDHADWPLVAKLSSLGVYAHMGLLFGVVNQLVLAALAIGLLCVVFWGYRMWWQRRPTRADRRRPVGDAPARSAWRRLPTWAVVVGVPLVLAAGYALPVLGVSLLAFLAFDLVLGSVRRRRTAGVVPVSPAPADLPEPAARS